MNVKEKKQAARNSRRASPEIPPTFNEENPLKNPYLARVFKELALKVFTHNKGNNSPALAWLETLIAKF